MDAHELNQKAVADVIGRCIDDRDTARRILRSLLDRQNEVEFKLGQAWTFNWDGPTTFVPESDADLAYLNELIGE